MKVSSFIERCVVTAYVGTWRGARRRTNEEARRSPYACCPRGRSGTRDVEPTAPRRSPAAAAVAAAHAGTGTGTDAPPSTAPTHTCAMPLSPTLSAVYHEHALRHPCCSFPSVFFQLPPLFIPNHTLVNSSTHNLSSTFTHNGWCYGGRAH